MGEVLQIRDFQPKQPAEPYSPDQIMPPLADEAKPFPINISGRREPPRVEMPADCGA